MSVKINEQNERIKRRFAIWKREARRAQLVTVDKALADLEAFEAFTGCKDFKLFRIEQAVEFKRYLEARKSRASGKPLAKATIDGTLRAVKDFFGWLVDQPGYRSRIKRSDLEYFNLNAKDARIAHTERDVDAPTVEQCRHAFVMMPEATLLERRNKAIFAALVLTGARDGALASIRLKHIDLVDSCLHQDAREMKTKAAKTFTTWFYPVDPIYLANLTDWVATLRGDLLFGSSDALFPKPTIGWVDGAFAVTGLSKTPYTNAAKIREVVALAFAAVGMPRFHPHSFRRTLVALGNVACKSPEEFKAWSMNLGHDSVVTTMQSYCRVPQSRQRELIKAMPK
jgi:integrase/recombinase XerD